MHYILMEIHFRDAIYGNIFWAVYFFMADQGLCRPLIWQFPQNIFGAYVSAPRLWLGK
jgi:hypothetical protein